MHFNYYCFELLNPSGDSIFLKILPIVISTIAIIFSGITLIQQRAHNIKSVKPAISIISKNIQNLYQISLENSGLGPALLDSVKITIKGQHFTSFCEVLDENPLVKLKATINPKGWENVIIHTGPEGHWLKPEGIIELITYNKELKEISEILIKIITECSITVMYSDLYRNKFECTEIIGKRENKYSPMDASAFENLK